MSNKKHTKLGEFFSTAICGNDILSSALYVSGIAIIFAGIYAPLALLAVGAVLLLYRSVYREVVEALPVNGGAYNALLNSSSKVVSAMAGTLTILSYIATAVISAKTAVEYVAYFLGRLFEAWHYSITYTQMQPFINPIVLIILFLFALLVISGVSESAKLAAGIFAFHVFTLISFIAIGAVALLSGAVPSVWGSNVLATTQVLTSHGGLFGTLFLAFSASLLGVSGFESSANFVEEQQPGVFAKTLRNMAGGVMIFNPLIALIILLIVPLATVGLAKDFILGEAAHSFGGLLMLGWIAIDAFLVLCGAVLTSYVGVTGLAYRLTIDRCLPQALVDPKAKNQKRIILGFFVLCASILLITRGELLPLAGVYTISFLSVMTSFAIANLILRRNRPDLQRPYRAKLSVVILAAMATFMGLMGNIAADIKNVQYFLLYFIPSAMIVLLVIYQKDAYKGAMKLFGFSHTMRRLLQQFHDNAANDRIYVFLRSKHLVAHVLNYIYRNESATRVTFVHCEQGSETCATDLEALLATIKSGGFYPNMQLDVVCVPEKFSPAVLSKFARQNRINKNKIFMGSIHEHHGFNYENVGGVRIIS